MATMEKFNDGDHLNAGLFRGPFLETVYYLYKSFISEIGKSFLPGGLNLDMSCSDGADLKGDGENVRENDFDHGD